MGSDADPAMNFAERLNPNREKNVDSDHWNVATSGKIVDISSSRQGLPSGHKVFEAEGDFELDTLSGKVKVQKGDKILSRAETIANKNIRTIMRLNE